MINKHTVRHDHFKRSVTTHHNTLQKPFNYILNTAKTKVHFHSYDYLITGGDEIVMLLLAKNLSERGLNSLLFFNHHKDDEYAELVNQRFMMESYLLNRYIASHGVLTSDHSPFSIVGLLNQWSDQGQCEVLSSDIGLSFYKEEDNEYYFWSDVEPPIANCDENGIYLSGITNIKNCDQDPLIKNVFSFKGVLETSVLEKSLNFPYDNVTKFSESLYPIYNVDKFKERHRLIDLMHAVSSPDTWGKTDVLKNVLDQYQSL